MKVEKINITKELLDIPDNQGMMTFLKTNGAVNMGRSLKESSVGGEVEGVKETWLVQRVRDSYGQIKCFLVKVDDKELFGELLEITNSVLKTKIRKALEKERRRIRELSFLKRLLKRF